VVDRFGAVDGVVNCAVSKAAVKLLTEGLHSELRHTNVRVTVVFPGAVATNITANSGVAIEAPAEGRRGSILAADEAASDILDGMEKNQFRVLVGRDAKMLDRLYRLHPKRATGSRQAWRRDRAIQGHGGHRPAPRA
jgi:short-subunit dehydrogenase